jgi:hypothetical protein
MTQTKTLSLTVLIASFALLSGCPVTNYSGDGTFVDNGASAANDRYILDLGPVDLTQRTQRTFRLAGLPKSNFVVGIQIKTADDPALISGRSLTPTVSLSLSESASGLIFSKKSSLREWTWSVPAAGDTAFVYGREDQSTHFDAVQSATYTLTLDVIEPDQSGLRYVAVLTAKTGGWK